MDTVTKKSDIELIGVGKTLFNSSCAKLTGEDLEVILTERLNKKKYSGEWPWRALEVLDINQDAVIADCRDVLTAKVFENAMNNHSPFDNFLESKKLSQFKSSEKTVSLTHHYAHALSGITFSKFDNALICVIDGAGSNSESFSGLTFLNGEEKFVTSRKEYEGISFYHYQDNRLTCINKTFFEFFKQESTGRVVTNSPGMLFEYASELIFNSKHDAGKVMGLSAFGEVTHYETIEELIEDIDWNRQFTGKTKSEWENSPDVTYYKNLASSVQNLFEKIVSKEIKRFSSHSSNLILVGGAAMNCVNNMKLIKNSAFESIEIPPCPGDEGISVGLVQYLYSSKKKRFYKNNSPYLGRNISPSKKEIEIIFNNYKVEYLGNRVIDYTADLLMDGKVLGWFQGRSEIGARALGNRSILARVDRIDLKKYLNDKIKFRESFRPYACSCLDEYSNEYFDVPNGFISPYMSFTVPAKKEWAESFKEVLHIDGTSRAQFVSKSVNRKFYDLISSVGDRTGLYAVLNTSLNVMGQPIVEDLSDLLIFFEKSNVDGLIVGDFFVSK